MLRRSDVLLSVTNYYDFNTTAEAVGSQIPVVPTC